MQRRICAAIAGYGIAGLCCAALAALGAVCLVYPLSYRAEIERAAEEFGLDPALVASIVRTESGFDPTAESGAGARGLMQLMPATAAWQAGRIGLAAYDLDDPKDNVRLGCSYYKYLYEKFGTELAALAAYNAGEGAVDRWLADPTCADEGHLRRIPYGETRVYCDRVLRAVRFYKLRFPRRKERAAACEIRCAKKIEFSEIVRKYRYFVTQTCVSASHNR